MKKFRIAAFSAITVFAVFYWFMEAINLNPLYYEGAIFWCVLISAYVAAWALLKFGEFIPQVLPNGMKNFSYQPAQKFPKLAKILIIAPWVFLIVMSIGSSVIFNWKAYRDQLGEPEIKTFSSQVQILDTNQIPVVDKYLAVKLADKKLGERPSLGSQVRLGVPTIQMVNEKLVWAVPLHHSGLFKWLTNMSGTPGYVLVSATNVNDVEYIDGYSIKYHPNSYLLHDLSRHVRFSGGMFEGITDYSFELDDNGQPYWVVSTYKNLRGFALPEATGAIIVNASTGETNKYALAEIPTWVDRVQPEDFIINQIYNKGEYVNGFLNFSDKDKYKPSDGDAIVYNEGKCYLFTGLTSVGADQSAIGFMMVDMVTKQPHLYQMNGATERSAQSSAQGKVQHLGYEASFPIILNIDGEATYFMTLKDREGLIKQYAFVNVSSYSSVGVGETIPAAMKDYEKVLKNSGIAADFAPAGDEKTATGEVLRIASEYNGTDTVYKIIVSGNEDKIFIALANTSDELALTEIGDNVTINYFDSESPIIAVDSFDNTMFNQQ